MKKILMLLERDFPPDGRVEKEALSLIKWGFDVHLACFSFGSKPVNEVYKGIHLHRLRVNRQIYKKSTLLMNIIPIYFSLWDRHINHLMKQHKFFAVHVHDLPLCGLGMKYARIGQAYYIADMHENYPFLMQENEWNRYWIMRKIINVPLWKRLEIKWLKPADRVIVTCKEMKDRLVTLGISGSGIYIVENTLTKTAVMPEGKPPDSQYITLVYVGGINKHRGIQVALEGFRMISQTHPNARFWIIGDGKYLNDLRKLVKDLDIPGVTFHGYLPRGETDDLIAQSDIGIIPHKKSDHTDNTSPNKVFEYFRLGKPVLASDCNYLIRVINSTGGGEIFIHSSASDFENSFYKMMKNGFVNYQNNALAAIENTYNWEETEKSLRELYSSLS